ncbi:MAG: zinc ribbon domain-containing protein [Oscillospiraceae bacterium]|nr:zinc ribbon domain-containing protein [Oscillospiraceae bacterium]
MAFCTNCGKELPEGAAFCTNCGSATAAQPAAPQVEEPQAAPQYQEPAYQYVPTPEYTYAEVPETSGPRKLATGQLVFSIINIVLGCCTCGGFIFGVIALILTIVAKGSKTDEDAAKKLKAAKILNIVGIIISALAVIAFVLLGAFGALGGMMAGFESGMDAGMGAYNDPYYY